MIEPLLITVFVIALAAFTVEGAIGFGGTVITASIGAQLLPLDLLLPAFVPINMVLSAWLLVGGRRSIAWRVLLAEIAPPVAIGAAIGLALWHVPAIAILSLVFAVFVVGLAALRLFAPSDRELPAWLRALLIAIGGIAHGLFGTGGPLIVYVVRRRLADKAAFRATLSVLWLTLNVALLVNFASLGKFTRETPKLLAIFAIALVPGLVLGERLHRALSPEKFERVVWIVLLVAGLALAIRSLV